LPQAVATRRVLVVDDDRVIRQCIAETLSEEGYEAVTAVNGADALDLVKSGPPPDLIVLDMRMPVLDGWGFAREYRALPGPHAPIVVITAAHDSLERLVEVQAVDVLPKPFDLDQLVRSVRSCLGRR
jgi:two-component system chemotaxis response regulator CheY